MTGPPLRAAAVGSGQIARHHLGFITASPLVDLVGVCDLSPVTAGYAAGEYGGVAHTDFARLLVEERPDVVHVLTPAHTHPALARQALEAGCHVICEKPVAPSLPVLEELLGVASSAGRRLTESQNYRYNDPVVAIGELVSTGRLGHVRDVSVAITLAVRDPSGAFGDPNLPNPIHQGPAGVIGDFTTHLVSVGLELSGLETVTSVDAAWNNHGGGDLFRYDDLDATVVGTSRSGPVHLRLRFDCSTAPDGFRVAVRGTSGSADADLFHPYLSVWVSRRGGRQLSPIVNHIVNGVRLARSGPVNLASKLAQNDAYHGLRRFLADTYEALSSGAKLPVDVDEMRQVSSLVDRLVERAP